MRKGSKSVVYGRDGQKQKRDQAKNFICNKGMVEVDEGDQEGCGTPATETPALDPESINDL
jgi:hypothetical protein